MPRPRNLQQIEAEAKALQAEYLARKRLDSRQSKKRKPQPDPNPPHRFGVLTIPPKVILRTGGLCVSLPDWE